ncbi:putative ferric reductase [Desulfohalotomaculum tongense]|uniref:ferric reductase-like transmembrane domain-containing protein n=1 Tax=Desulforadius tongensis TaxID=1216062 RepID=UPI001955FFA7|nr:ferric reductase-like transmembrane domain-containing protein [Desulforadius tongensis]MBM7853914.1 putative ferric reductase [Desulforadius tongensis]
MRFNSELLEFTGWMGLILLGMCLINFLVKGKSDSQLISFARRNHKIIGWLSLVVLSVHGFLAYSAALPTLGRGRHYHLLVTIGWGQITWAVLLIICVSSLVLSYKIFKRGHLLMVMLLALLVFIHVL